METFEIVWSEPIESSVTIFINRPNVHNALNAKFWIELNGFLDELAKKEEIRFLVIKGRGKSFSSGADLKESKGRTLKEYEEHVRRVQLVSKRLLYLNQVTVACIQGYALGAGLELALACDFRFGFEDAVLGLPEAKVSSYINGGTTIVLPKIVGKDNAALLLYTSRRVNANEAKDLGLIQEVWKEDNLNSFLMELFENSRTSIELFKKALQIDESLLDKVMEEEVVNCIKSIQAKERESALKGY
jgi:enoyl-CoA hydratase